MVQAILPFLELIPGPGEAVRGVAAGAAVFLAAGFLAGIHRARGGRPGDSRKIFHFLVFTTAAAIRFAFGIQTLCAYGTIVFLGVLLACARGEGDLIYEALARPTDAPHRTLHVIVPLLATAAGGLAAHFLAGEAAPAALLVGGWGDAVGEPVGIRWGRRKFEVPSLGGVPSSRSVEGTAAVFGASFLAAALGLAATGAGGAGAALLARSLAVAAAATVVESFSPHGLDNLTVLVTAALVVRVI